MARVDMSLAYFQRRIQLKGLNIRRLCKCLVLHLENIFEIEKCSNPLRIDTNNCC